MKNRLYEIGPLLKGETEEINICGELILDKDVLGREDLNLIGTVGYDIDLYRAKIGVLGKGKVRACLGLKCSRCLKNIKKEEELDFEELFVKRIEIEEEDDDYLDVFDIESDKIDIILPVRQLILLSVPVKPLCKELCKGICPSCGVDLNENKCDCKKEDYDVRWEALKNFKKDKKK